MWQSTSTSDKFDWYHAIAYCADLEYAGYDDWRLPTLRELASIMDFGGDSYAINRTYFPVLYIGRTWTSKQIFSDSTRAWDISFTTGELERALKSETYYVKCIRGESLSENSSFTVSAINEKNIVTDNETGLIWQGSASESTVTWQQALEYCENSEYAGYTDWRLPNINELLSILNFEKRYSATDFPTSIPSNYFWTSSRHYFQADRVVVLSTSNGSFYSQNISSGSSYALCVR